MLSYKKLKRQKLVTWIQHPNFLPAPAVNFLRKILPPPAKIYIATKIYYLKSRLVKRISRDLEGTMNLSDRAVLKFSLNDPYWIQYAKDSRKYEPEIWYIFDRFIDMKTVFLDGGANIGFWSVVAGTKIRNPKQVIAIEPSEHILPMLKKNWSENNRCFTIVEAALWARSGETLIFNMHTNHAASSLIDNGLKDHLTQTIEVQTIHIDGLVDQVIESLGGGVLSSINQFIIKIDVEGVEKQALEGAKNTIENYNTLLIYEDHGAEQNSEATDFFLANGLHIYFIDAQNKVRRIKKMMQLGPIKTDPTKGYNFMACRPESKFDLTLEAEALL